MCVGGCTKLLYRSFLLIYFLIIFQLTIYDGNSYKLICFKTEFFLSKIGYHQEKKVKMNEQPFDGLKYFIDLKYNRVNKIMVK